MQNNNLQQNNIQQNNMQQSNMQQNNMQQNNMQQNNIPNNNTQRNCSYLNDYFNKQIKFRTLIKEIQKELKSKDYIQQGYTYDEFIKIKWNISKAQVYRYLICAKVIDQLEEFEIQPSYERLCRSLYNHAKTPQQMKLLWKSVLQKAKNRPDCINSSHVKKAWKELCMDKRYSHICHCEEEIMSNIEKSLNNYNLRMKLKKQMSQGGHIPQNNLGQISPNSQIPSSGQSSLNGSNEYLVKSEASTSNYTSFSQNIIVNKVNNPCTTQPYNYLISPVSSCQNSVVYDDSSSSNINNGQYTNIPNNASNTQYTNIPNNANNTQFTNIPNNTNNTQYTNIPNTPNNTQYTNIPNTPNNTQYTNIPNTPNNTQYTNIPNTPNNTQYTNIPNTPNSAQYTNIPNTPNNTQYTNISNNPNNAQFTNIVNTPNANVSYICYEPNFTTTTVATTSYTTTTIVNPTTTIVNPPVTIPVTPSNEVTYISNDNNQKVNASNYNMVNATTMPMNNIQEQFIPNTYPNPYPNSYIIYK